MDHKLDLDAERTGALEKWQVQADDLQRLVSRLQAIAYSVPSWRRSFDDWRGLSREDRMLLSEFCIFLERLARLLTVRRRLERAFRKKAHKVEVTIGVVASRKIHEAADLDPDRLRGEQEGNKAANGLCIKFGLVRVPDFTGDMINRAVKRFYPS